MQLIMNHLPVGSIAQMEEFLKTTESLSFKIPKKKDGYRFVSDALLKSRYRGLKKKGKTTVLRYLRKCTGYSKSHLKLLIRQRKRGPLVWNPVRDRNRFGVKYGAADIARLIETDVAHHILSGEATKKIMEREYAKFGKESYANISRISVSHIYNIRNGNAQYNSSDAKHFTKTKASSVDIGVRRKPVPNGSPGFLRVDTVHQGDRDREKGVYHINLVDEVTQWEMVFSVDGISERFLKPVLKEALSCFQFVIHEFHADNGSEYINHVVAGLLGKMHVVLSKSRARRSSDNALVESKNGSVIRKLYGRNFIETRHAPLMNVFNREHVNVYLVYHRPCGFATESVDAKGKVYRVYREWTTPYEKLKSLPDAFQYLKEGVSFESLDTIAYAESDNDCAKKLQDAKEVLFKKIRSE